MKVECTIFVLLLDLCAKKFKAVILSVLFAKEALLSEPINLREKHAQDDS